MFVCGACNGPSPSKGPSASPASSAAPLTSGAVAPAPSGAPSASNAAFEVHEWGLVDVQSATVASLVGGPPGGRTNWNAPRRKPVLYFHLADGTSAVDATVTVTAPRLKFVETFPKGELSTDSSTLTWRNVHVRKESCHVTGAPGRESPECRTADGQCEAAELPTYEAADASCIDVAGAAFNHLFYRANGAPPELPYDVVVKGNQLSIAHARASDIVGPILYVHNDGGAVTVSQITPPAVGGSTLVDPPKNTDVKAAQSALDAAMKEVGLTDAEIGAFDRAWANDLFGNGAARDLQPRRAAIALPVSDVLLFVLPASQVNSASTVTVTPAPRAVRRFMLVRMRV